MCVGRLAEASEEMADVIATFFEGYDISDITLAL